MENRTATLVVLASLAGTVLVAMVPAAVSCSADVNLGRCEHGCRVRVNLGTCTHGCRGIINAGSCGHGNPITTLLSGPPHCGDGLDNDGDGTVDTEDANCLDRFGRFESSDNACPDQNVHNYAMGTSVAYDSATMRSTGLSTGAGGIGVAFVMDTNVADCNGATPTDGPDGIPGDWDGDYDQGVGGAFFFYGTHAINDVCGYGGNVGGPNVVVDDIAFADVTFVTAENDQNGPIYLPIVDPITNEQIGAYCDTPGGITPAIDSDDCISDADSYSGNSYTPYTNVGQTCGSGGGDGGFWVFLDGVAASDSPPGVSNPPTSGTITRS